MPKTIQIRDLDDDVYRQLQRRAAETGITVPELLRKEAARLVSRPSLAEWMERTSRRSWDATNQEVVEALDEIRGPWPDAGS
ncbi:MAG: FitA-like ribbon-helix-helix domain-containing protein [Actinomycetota bacterium]